MPLDQSQLLLGNLLVVSLNATILKAGQAFLFVREPTAHVAASKDLIAGLGDLFHAVGLTAAVVECWELVIVLLLDFDCAEAALSGVLIRLGLFAGHTDVVGGPITTCAEVLLALGAPHTEVGHVIGGLPRNDLTCFVFLSVVGLGWLKINDSVAGASDHIWIKIDTDFHLFLLDHINIFSR